MESSCTILILEPGLARRAMHRQTLGDDYTLLFAATPLEALTIIARQRPDLMVLSVRIADMPTMARDETGRPDGVDIVRMVKRSPLQQTPIILCGEQLGLLDALRAHRAGADRYLPGPFDGEVLREAIGEMLSPKIITARLRSRDFFWTREMLYQRTRVASV